MRRKARLGAAAGPINSFRRHPASPPLVSRLFFFYSFPLIFSGEPNEDGLVNWARPPSPLSASPDRQTTTYNTCIIPCVRIFPYECYDILRTRLLRGLPPPSGRVSMSLPPPPAPVGLDPESAGSMRRNRDATWR
ncbi:hypothetical protein LX36DRAFT_373508 [Colletotrichum falcatum]|nr:hypothetical protein LX36DRAFT_373508 [Colletotrichum falcatum]